MKPVVRKGDSTSTGGVVVEGAENSADMKRPVAHKGDWATCPRCDQGGGPIAEGFEEWYVKGRPVALHGYVVACGCPWGTNRVLSTQFEDGIMAMQNGAPLISPEEKLEDATRELGSYVEPGELGIYPAGEAIYEESVLMEDNTHRVLLGATTPEKGLLGTIGSGEHRHGEVMLSIYGDQASGDPTRWQVGKWLPKGDPIMNNIPKVGETQANQYGWKLLKGTDAVGEDGFWYLKRNFNSQRGQ